ncbi:putative Hematopoietic prostaglandin D synthase [Hypsibius exemplaris]|uniref:glutathione transferase n=1 Tax=Hypsibius exemplaris TaxID=2072580 RepID=A0A9X6ND66_HYPEX|nr:putative Hematopoietic prostaglandin D synthase [Hypsibius exemplaris]
MAPHFKLVYFDVPGRAELTRWIFAYAGREFEDFRVNRADWPALKPKTPTGKLPYLEVDGKPSPESIAIARFAARETGLAGKDNFESARIDALIDYLGDAQKGLQALRTEPDEKKKAALKEEYIKVGLQPYLQGLERHLAANNNGEGFLFGNEPTWADFALTVFVDNPAFDTTLLDNYALLNAHHKRVHELKAIKEWLQKHSANA